MIVAFTGHRPDKIGGYDMSSPEIRKIRYELFTKLKKLKPKKAISGMALGVDQLAAEACIAAEIPFIAARPFIGQELKWPLESQKRYRELLGQASEIVTVCDGAYAAWKMQKRNEWMVDHCDLLLAVWDGSAGGTANCVKYARSIGKTILHYNPMTFTWSPEDLAELDLEELRLVSDVREHQSRPD